MERTLKYSVDPYSSSYVRSTHTYSSIGLHCSIEGHHVNYEIKQWGWKKIWMWLHIGSCYFPFHLIYISVDSLFYFRDASFRLSGTVSYEDCSEGTDRRSWVHCAASAPHMQLKLIFPIRGRDSKWRIQIAFNALQSSLPSHSSLIILH